MKYSELKLFSADSSGSVKDADIEICLSQLTKRKKREQKMSREIRVMYLRDHKGQPQGCVACQIKRSGNDYVGSYQLSVLNPVDKFNRGVARALAKGRLLENPIQFVLPSSPSMHEITDQMMAAIATNESLPTRARKSAQRWLDEADRTFSF